MRKYLLAFIVLVSTSFFLRPTSWSVFQAKAPAEAVLPLATQSQSPAEKVANQSLSPAEKVAKLERELIIAKMELQLYDSHKNLTSLLNKRKTKRAVVNFGGERWVIDNGVGIDIQTFQDTINSSNITNKEPFYKQIDESRFAEWKKQKNVDFEGKSTPRTLIYTWCTEDTFSAFQNEVYWKSCYAHLHGFDIVFSGKKKFSGLAKWDEPIELGTVGSWYSEENMWALWSDIQRYLKSGKYDYVFMTGADTLFNPNYIDWPVWHWDRGHDVTVMDQHSFPFQWSYGLNENSILFKATDAALDFIQEVFEFRKGFHLQGDNGPYMEAILRTLGRWAESEGRMGYHQKCYELCQLPKPSVLCMGLGSWWERRNDDFDKCFFSELDRLIGGYGYRNSSVIGFYPTFIGYDGNAFYPKDWLEDKRPYVPPQHIYASLSHGPWGILGPWANCWSSVRKYWKEPWLNCFAYHWNGPKNPSEHTQVSGECYDDTFNWEAHNFNPANRPKSAAP